MSAAGGGEASVAIAPSKTIALGVIGGLVGIYATPFNPVLGPLLASLGAVCAIVWGADAIRRVASYGLGTGVPSIGYMSLAIGIIGVLAGLSGAIMIGPTYTLISPLFAFAIAMILGGVVAIIGKKVVGMKIPILVQCTIELSGAAALSVLGFSAAIAGSYAMPAILASVVSTGFIGLLFILNTMAIQHPFNACLGPNEDQTRTLKLAATTAFMSMAIIGLLGIGSHSSWWVISVVGALGWFISMRAFLTDSLESAASVKWSGLWPKEDEQ